MKGVIDFYKGWEEYRDDAAEQLESDVGLR